MMKAIRMADLIWRETARLLASFFYLGYLPVAPGTMGAVGGMLLYLAISILNPAFLVSLRGGYLAFMGVFFIVGVATASRGEKIWGEPDPPTVVIDEAFSYFITMFMLPVSPIALIGGLVLNRIFDIVKPPPADFAENLSGGLGVMMDDVVAGCYSHICLRVLLWLLRV